MLKPFSLIDGRRFRDILIEAGYCREETHQKLRTLLRGRNLARLMDQTGERTLLDTLLRWFRIGVPVDFATAAELAPAWALELCVEHGLLVRQDDVFLPMVMLLPGEGHVIASDPVAKLESGDSADIVIWPSPSTGKLWRFTMRRPFGDVLDLGSGTGVQAVHAARHSGRVVATDLNPRAAGFASFNASLNGVDNIECLTGDTYQPVEGRKFDLIVSNPPFFINPVADHMFSETGMELDQYCRKVVREGAGYLREGGFLQVIVEWAEVRGQPWRERISEWVEGTGCDAWIWRENATAADEYAENRTAVYPAPSVGARYLQWMAYYREKNLERVHSGMIALRRRSGNNWVRMDEIASEPTEPFGEAVWQGFAARDFLDAHADDDRVLAVRPRLSPDTELHPRLRPGENGWDLVAMNVSLNKGLRASLSLDPIVANFVGQMNGAPTLREMVQALAAGGGVDPEQAGRECAQLLRRLIELGMVTVPV